ncbi:MAG: heavy metal translocating P-type ATPase [Candidatus Firestonebacteria bacterium]
MSKLTINISGMSCASCVSNIENTVKKLNGILTINVSLALKKGQIEYNPDEVSDNKIKQTIKDLGYEVFISEAVADLKSKKEIEGNYYKLISCAILSAIIFIFGFLEKIPYVISFVLVLPVQFWGGWQFYKGFWKNLKNFQFDMNTLISIGTSSAFIYSVVATFFPQFISEAGLKTGIYYDTSAVIITLVLFGRFLDAKAKNRASLALEKLIKLHPKFVHIIRDSKESDILLNELKHNDIVVVKSGERIPADGIVIDGFSTVDESMLTGESLPVEKKANDKITAGTINYTGTFKFNVLKTGGETVLAQMVKMVEEALLSKAPIQNFADKVAGIFVPSVIIIAILTFVVWMIFGKVFNLALLNFVSVLIIACPCALGLATPMAIIVGVGKASEMGILFKSAGSIEMLHKTKVLIFDKTGTLTFGKPEIKNIIPFKGYLEHQILEVAGSVSQKSEHPYSKAILSRVREGKIKLFEPIGFEEFPGNGINAKLGEKNVLLGSLNFMKEKKIDLSDMNNISEIGFGSLTYVVVDNMLVGILVMADEVRPDAKMAIESLKNIGVDTVLLTGDNKTTADKVAKELGINKVFAEVLPQDKAFYVQQFQSDGKIVAMVGDGINDALALANANVGIAVATGSDIAIEAADVTLMKNDLLLLATTINLSKKMMRIIKQNLFWAFAYNVLGIPIAAGILYPFLGEKGFLNPMFASFAMAMSSLSVILNSLRLKR